MSNRRQIKIEDCGREIQCAKCKEFWPDDAEFYFQNRNARGSKSHSWCIACYMEDKKAKRQGNPTGGVHNGQQVHLQSR